MSDGQSAVVPEQTRESPDEIAANIIQILSRSAYTSFPQALREIISNAYDADAGEVHVKLAPQGQSLVITDDGSGLNQDEFRTRYARIATPKGRLADERTPKYGRRPIGKFGIGHLSIAPTCARARLVTTKGRGKEVFEAILDYEEYLDEKNLSRPLSEVYQYYARELPEQTIRVFPGAPARADQSFTMIELEDLKEEIARDLRRPGASLTQDFESTSDLSGLMRLEWELGSIAPIQYVEGGPVSGFSDKILEGIVSDLTKAKFKVWLGDHQILRPIRLPAFGKKFKERPKRGRNYEVYTFEQSIQGHGLEFRGYIFNQSSQIIPRELRGILVRVRGVAIGLYRADFLGAKITSSVFRDSTTGEVYVDEGLDDAITLDRANFKESDPAYRALRGWLERYLANVRKDYWARGRSRKTERVRKKEARFTDRVSDEVGRFFAGPAAPPAFSLVQGKNKDGRPCTIDMRTGEIRLDPHHRIFRKLPAAGREREVLQVCLYALEIAHQRAEDDIDKFYREALSVIEELLDEIYGQ